MALANAYDGLGCCLYSFYAVVAGRTAADGIFKLCSDDPTTLCVGGASGETLQLPTGSIDVDPQCERFVEDVEGSCRNLLSEDIIATAYVDLDQLCSDTCGPEVYQFYRDCDQQTGVHNASVMDVFCATNSGGQRCGDLLTDFSTFNLESCEGIRNFTCPAACREALQQAFAHLGCCLPSLIQLLSGIDFASFASYIGTVCDVEIVGDCDGHFSGRPAPPPPEEDECSVLEQNLPPECAGYSSPEVLVSLAYFNPFLYQGKFCRGPCGRPVYDYLTKCDMMRGSANASLIDLLCSQNSKEASCAGILSDPRSDVIDKSCSDTAKGMCSTQCSKVLQQLSQTWGCCLFSLVVIDTNISSEAASVMDNCRDHLNSDVCIGGLSGQPVVPVPAEPSVGPTSDRCSTLHEAIPAKCGEISSFNSLLLFASERTDEFYRRFCKSDCAKPVYSYIECLNSTEATYTDFLCSETSSETHCADLAAHKSFEAVVRDGVCKDATDKQCSQLCQTAFKGFNKVYGCCLFSYIALDTNVTYSNDLWAQCGVDNPGLCDGGISNAPISAPDS